MDERGSGHLEGRGNGEFTAVRGGDPDESGRIQYSKTNKRTLPHKTTIYGRRGHIDAGGLLS